MKILFYKSVIFAFLVSATIFVNMMVFRSDYPLFWIPSALVSLILLVAFPYKKFFNL